MSQSETILEMSQPETVSEMSQPETVPEVQPIFQVVGIKISEGRGNSTTLAHPTIDPKDTRKGKMPHPPPPPAAVQTDVS